MSRSVSSEKWDRMELFKQRFCKVLPGFANETLQNGHGPCNIHIAFPIYIRVNIIFSLKRVVIMRIGQILDGYHKIGDSFIKTFRERRDSVKQVYCLYERRIGTCMQLSDNILFDGFAFFAFVEPEFE